MMMVENTYPSCEAWANGRGVADIITAPQHLVCRVVRSLHINHMQMSIIEVFICRRLHMNTSMILICIWLVCRLCTTLHTKSCGAVHYVVAVGNYYYIMRPMEVRIILNSTQSGFTTFSSRLSVIVCGLCHCFVLV